MGTILLIDCHFLSYVCFTVICKGQLLDSNEFAELNKIVTLQHYDALPIALMPEVFIYLEEVAVVFWVSFCPLTT